MLDLIYKDKWSNKALHRTAASPGAEPRSGLFSFRFHLGTHRQAAVGELLR